MSTDIQDVSTALEGIVQRLASSLVSVISHRTQASGFVWRDGLIVTSNGSQSPPIGISRHLRLWGAGGPSATILARQRTKGVPELPTKMSHV